MNQISRMRDSVDVVIPNYNQYEHLCTAITSCLSQDYQVAKIIVVDDGSRTEIQEKIIQKWGSHPKVQLHLNNHSGLPGLCRVSGIQHSEADWIAFLDSDDYWSKNKISRQLEVARKYGAGFVASNAVKLFGSEEFGNMFDFLPLKLSFAQAAQSNLIVNSSVLLRRSILSEEFDYATSHNVRAVEDYATWLRILTKYDCYLLGEPLTFYRESPGSIRKEVLGDPRGHAFADFLNWSKLEQNQTNIDLQRHRNLILEQVALES